MRSAETDRQMQGEASAWLAAVVHNSFDAILSKTLDGIITSWNEAAERLFGFSATEAIGQAITIIVPPDRHSEETDILARLRQGDSIERFETVRRHRSGRLIDIELSVSPVRDHTGAIVGASTIARDITDRKRRREEQALIVREMHHRIGNLLAVVQSIISFSKRRSAAVEDFATDLSDRIVALAAAHQLVLPEPGDSPRAMVTTLGEAMEALLKPYFHVGRISIKAPALTIDESALTPLALLLHELATNAAKYGALAVAGGALDIAVAVEGERVRIVWRETGGQAPNAKREGFGSGLLKAAAQSLDAQIERRWEAPALTIAIDMPHERLMVR